MKLCDVGCGTDAKGEDEKLGLQNKFFLTSSNVPIICG